MYTIARDNDMVMKHNNTHICLSSDRCGDRGLEKLIKGKKHI